MTSGDRQAVCDAASEVAREGPGGAALAPEIVSLLDSDDAHIRRAALTAGVALGTAAVPALLDGLRSTVVRIRTRCAELLAWSPDERTVQALVTGARQDPDEGVRAACLRRLARAGPEVLRHGEFLRGLSRREEAGPRADVAGAIAAVASMSDAYSEDLVRLLDDADGKVRWAALAGMLQASPSGRKPLQRVREFALDTNIDPHTTCLALSVLWQVRWRDEEIRSRCAQLVMESGSEFIREIAAEVYCYQADFGGVDDVLLRALGDSHARVRDAARSALLEVQERSGEALTAIVALDPHPASAVAAQTLGEFRRLSVTAQDALRRSLDSREPELRAEAAVALLRHGLERSRVAAILGEVLRRGPFWLRYRIACELERVPSPPCELAEVVRVLGSQGEDPLRVMCFEVLGAMRDCKDARVDALLWSAVRGHDLQEAVHAAKALARRGSKEAALVPVLVGGLPRFFSPHALEGIAALGLAATSAELPVRRALDELDPSVRLRAASALLAMGSRDRQVLSVLALLLDERDHPTVRAEAAGCLGDFGAGASVHASRLRGLSTTDLDRRVREAAARALKAVEEK